MQAPIAPGTLLHNRYCLIGAAGQSKFGQTYLARDQKRLNELCVVKEFTPAQSDPAAVESLRQRFHQGVSGLYELQHPQLPRLRMMFAQDERLYWVRDYVEGKSYSVLLEERKAQGQCFSEAEVIQFLLKVLPVLTYLHNRGVVHCNLSLDTLILRQQDQLPIVINFGLVQELVTQLQLHPLDPSQALGQWGFVPPEQLYGKADPTSDLYALAVAAIVLLTAKTPESLYNSQTQQLDWEPLVSVSPAFVRLLRQMLHPHPQKRLAAAAQVSQILEPMLANAAVDAAPVDMPETSAQTGDALQALPTRLPRKRLRPKRKSISDPRASAAMVVGIVLLLAAIAWKFLLHKQPIAKPVASPSPVAVSPAVPRTVPTASPRPTASAEVSQDALRDRRRQLNIDFQFFTSLVDEAFYAKNPQLRSRSLDNPEQAKLRTEWNAIASRVMDKLATLKPETRQRLGSYRRINYDQWLATLGETGAKKSPRLDALADGRFWQLFPEQKGKALNPRTFGQVWYAIADEQVGAAKAQKPPINSSRQTSGNDTNGNRSL
ncbi:MAG: protein kinase [Stenomitos frigidus ULC029]